MGKRKKTERLYDPQFDFNKQSHYSDYVNKKSDYFLTHPSAPVKAQYEKEKRKPKRLSRLFSAVAVLVSIAIAVIVTSSTVLALFMGKGGSGYVEKGSSNVHNFVGLGVRPDDPDFTIDLSEYESAKDKAAYLYLIGSQKATAAEHMTGYNSGLLFLQMGASDNYMDIDTVMMKTQTEYFYIEYHLKNSVPILDTFLGGVLAKATDVITTERKYAGVNDKKMVYQKVKNNEYDENGVPHASWDATIAVNTPTVAEKDMPVFSSSQNGNFRITNHNVLADTISDAEVSFNEEEGYYVVSLTLDHTNGKTVEKSLADIQSGTGDENAKYSYLKIDFTVWDNGYFRTFDIVEKWDAKVVIALSFELTTHWTLSYNKKDCNINAYPDAKAMKQFLKK